MLIVWILLIAVVICFGGVLLFGAPYLPTLSKQVASALELAQAREGQTMLELGCGDGKVAIAAARKGVTVIGYELNPVLVLIAKARTFKYRKKVKIIWGDFWRAELPKADIIFVFLLPRYMKKMDKKVIQYKHKPVKFVSFAFAIPGKDADRERNGVRLYTYR